MLEEHNHDVIVIGAGISGLKSAIELNKNGLNTIILEARDRLGGRLYSQEVDGFPVDLGASWFHDCLTNPLFLKYMNSSNVSYYFDDGKPAWLSSLHQGELEYLTFEPIIEEFFKYIELNTTEVSQDPSKDDSLHNLINKYILEKKQFLTEEQIKYTPQLARFIELWFGSCWDQTSALGATELEHNGRNAFITSGYQSVYRNELKEFPRNRIYCNKLVNQVEKLPKNKIKVRCLDGSIYISSYIICTIPQPCLTSTDFSTPGAIKWVPELPYKLTKFFPKMSFAALGKVAFKFDDIFWPLENDRIWCIGDPIKHIDEISGEPLKHKILPENGTLATRPDAWEYPVLFVNVAKFTAKPMLILLIQAPITQYIESLDSDAQVWEYFEPYFQKFANNKKVKPVKIVKTDWTRDPLARGSYTGGKVGGDYEGGINLLIRGLPQIRFAGEHTIFEGNGCAHGAWLSGKREAEYIIKKFNKL